MEAGLVPVLYPLVPLGFPTVCLFSSQSFFPGLSLAPTWASPPRPRSPLRKLELPLSPAGQCHRPDARPPPSEGQPPLGRDRAPLGLQGGCRLQATQDAGENELGPLSPRDHMGGLGHHPPRASSQPSSRNGSIIQGDSTDQISGKRTS